MRITFGQVSIDQPFVDWSGNCGNLSAAVGPFAIAQGMLPAERIPENGFVEGVSGSEYRQNHHQSGAHYQRTGSGNGAFELDGVTFPAAEIAVDFVDPADALGGAMFPTGNLATPSMYPAFTA